jgi:hypothetical protein
MGNNKKKKSNKKPQAAAAPVPTVEEQVIQKVEPVEVKEVKIVEEKIIEQPQVSSKRRQCCTQKMSEIEKDLKKMDLNKEKA